jgi:leucyl/phenylalanyl-tRNA---protein transferase
MMEALPRIFFLRMIDSELLLHAYRLGVFPMALPNDEIGWFSPDPRTILPLEAFHVPHGLRRERARQQLEIRINTCFAEVMRACAARPDTWINDEIVASYVRLHELGFAHSLEAWSANELVGGLYGVAIGGAFFGESMFHRATGASKVALWELVERLRAREFTLLDTQWLTPHLAQFGAREIPRPLYLHLLQGAIELPRAFA